MAVSLFEYMDMKVMEIWQSWNSYTTLLVVGIITYVLYTIISAQDPDTHPMILLRQSTASLVRQPGESAVYRSPDTPHGYPLRTGLDVKPPGAPAYSSGRDGDLRDVWRRVTGDLPPQKSPVRDDSPVPNVEQKILTVMGREEIIDHKISDVTKEIIIVGEHIKKHGGKRVALYLPNSIEFLTAVFAASFYGLDIILIPFNQPHEKVVELLRKTNADALIAQAGAIPFEPVSKGCPSIKLVIWFVEHTSRHMDWTEVPEEIGGKVEVDAWHELVQNHQNVTSADLPDIKREELGKIVTIWQGRSGDAEVVEFTHQNMVAAISALIAAIPVRQRFNPSDLFLAADSLTYTYTLCLTLAAMFSQSSLALNSVAGPTVDLVLACRSIAPTIIVASADTAAKLHAETAEKGTGPLAKLACWIQSRALEAGRMPVDSFFTRMNAPKTAAIGTTPGKLRLIFVAEKAGIDTPELSSNQLSDLRIFMSARPVYALTAAKVAGAVAQTMMYDYRRDGYNQSHFGLPMSSVEVKLVDKGEAKTTEETTRGEIVVTGPSVAGGETRLGVLGTIRDDNTLAYL